MRRSLRRLEALANGERFGDTGDTGDTEEAMDALVHFFQDAFHLKDWIKNDGSATTALREAVEDLFCAGGKKCRRPDHRLGPKVMRLSADICNGSKDQTLDDNRRFLDSGIASEHVKVGPFAADTGEATRPPRHSWTILVDSEEVDALTTASQIIKEWDRWLTEHGLQPPS